MARVGAIRARQAEPPPGIRALGLDVVHRWITRLEPGEVDLAWEVDGTHANLEGAVLCSWTTALADQALFFAGTSLCADGEQTRMAQLSLTCVENIRRGPVGIEGRVLRRDGNRMLGTCTFTSADGAVLAHVTATLDVVPA